MSTKLTLTIDQQVIEAAKRYAQINGRSVSNLVETYLKSLTAEETIANEYSPRLKSLIGAISLPEDVDYKELLAEELHKKYGQ